MELWGDGAPAENPGYPLDDLLWNQCPLIRTEISILKDTRNLDKNLNVFHESTLTL